MDTIGNALRGMLSGLALVSFIGFFLLMRVGNVSPQLLIGLGFVSFVVLMFGGGFSTVRELLLGEDTTKGYADSTHAEWWATRAMHPFEGQWNKWSDLVVILGLGIIGIGSFVLLAIDQSGNPPLGLLFVGFISSTGALVCLALLIE